MCCLAEMIRHTKVAGDTARKGRTSAIITLKALIVNAPAELSQSLDDCQTNRSSITAPRSPRRQERHDILSHMCAANPGTAMDLPR